MLRSAECKTLCLELAPASIAAPGRKDENGQPIQRYTKQILRTGDVFNAGHKWTLTPEFLDEVVMTFSQMKADGIIVRAQDTHAPGNKEVDPAKDPAQSRGVIHELWRDGNILMASVDMIGDDAIRAASRVDVSVNIEPTYSVNGKSYRNALTHLALCPDPAIPGMKPFVRLAASLDANVYRLNQGTSPMWKPIALALSLDVSKLDDTTGPAAVETAVKATVAERNAAATALNEANTRNAALSLSVSKGAPQIGDDILDEHADIVGAKLDGLVTSGIVTPDQKTKLAAIFTGEKGKRPALCLSRAAATHAGLSAPLALSVIDILATGKGKTFGSKTGDQGKGSTNDDAPDAPGADFHSRVDSFLPVAAKK